VSINQSPELKQFGINDGRPDSANLANARLMRRGSTGKLAVELTECFDEEIDKSLKRVHAVVHKKRLSPSCSKSNT